MVRGCGVAQNHHPDDEQTPTSHTRISFIHNPSQPNGISSGGQRRSRIFSQLMTTNAMYKLSPSQLLQVIGAPSKQDQVEDRQNVLSQDEVPDSLLDAINDFDAVAYDGYIRTSRLVARDLHLAPGEQALILNGRVRGRVHFLRLLVEVA
jgi:UDP-glucose:glycoprotein glucosyltransferase